MPPSIAKIRQMLPPADGKGVMLVDWQTTDDIVDEILGTHNEYAKQYDLISDQFDTGDIYSTCQGLWEFLKYNLHYRAESEEKQSIKSPSRILRPGEKVDCKHYSLFAGGVLDSIKRKYNDGWNWCYRFVSYDKKKIPGHVFVVVKNGGNEIWIDPVLTNFNQRKPYNYYLDETPMALYKLTGIGNTDNTPVVIDSMPVAVNPAVAEQKFLTMITLNTFGVKDLLKNNPTVVNTSVRAYYQKNGFDFDQLLRFINS